MFTVFGIVLAAVLLYLLFILPTQWLKVERVRVDLGLHKKVLQLSDLHMERVRVLPNQLKKLIEKEKPDYIFLTGDFLDTEPALLRLKEYLSALSGPPVIPRYAVLGNHDYRLPKVKRLIDVLQSGGVCVLRNEAVDLGDFVLLGIDDYGTYHDNAAKAYRDLDETQVRKTHIVLQHDPNYVLENTWPFDYLLSGHLHGKQLNLPFIFWIQNMGPLPRMGIYKGLHTCPQGPYYISKGIGQSGWNVRFLVRSEVTVHEV